MLQAKGALAAGDAAAITSKLLAVAARAAAEGYDARSGGIFEAGVPGAPPGRGEGARSRARAALGACLRPRAPSALRPRPLAAARCADTLADTPSPAGASTDKVWWVQAEAMLALWQLHARTGGCEHLQKLRGTLQVRPAAGGAAPARDTPPLACTHTARLQTQKPTA